MGGSNMTTVEMIESLSEQTKNELSEVEKHFVKQIETTAKKLNPKKPKK